MEYQRRRRGPWPRAAVVAAVGATWAVVAFFFASQVMLGHRRLFGRPADWSAALAVNLLYYSLWAAATPLVVRLVRRFGFGNGRSVRNAAVHLVAAGGLAVLLPALFELLRFSVFPIGVERGMRLQDAIAFSLSLNVHVNVLTYGLVAGTVVLVDALAKGRERTRREQELEERLADAQLKALKLQLHPHFLFNTLNGVSPLIRKDPEAADRMIVKLGEFLHAVLARSEAAEVTLAEELELVERYLAIEEGRFESRLSVRLEVAADVRAALVPSLLLQPIVENALKHGLSLRDGPLALSIAASRAGDRLVVRVADDGVGPVPAGDASAARPGHGLGLANTRERLARLYGDRSEFRLETSEARGATVTIHLPYHENAPAAPARAAAISLEPAAR